MADQRKISRKPLPTGSRYAALSTTATHYERNLPGSPATGPASAIGELEHYVSSSFDPAQAQWSLQAQNIDDDTCVNVDREITIPILAKNNENLNGKHQYATNEREASRSRSNGSIWLSLPYLTSIWLLVVAVVVALSLLYHFANKEQGFNVDLDSSIDPYAWRYSLVAVLTLMAALWQQTDYHCKVETPNLHIQYRPTLGRNSLLLDYVSPWLPVGMYIAIRNQDWKVVATSSAYGLFKLAIIASTGLFALQQTTMTLENQPLPLVWSLEHIDFNGTYFSGPVDAYWGIVAAGLDYTRGTDAFAAFPIFSTGEKFPTDASISAEIDALFSTLECEVAQSENVAVNVFRSWTDNCSVGNYSATFCVKNQSDCTTIASRSVQDGRDVTLSAVMWPFVCGGRPANVEEDSIEINFLLALLEAQNVTNTGQSTQT